MPHTRNRTLHAGAAAVAVLLIGWIDLETGPEIGLSLFYLVPIAIAGWVGGTVGAIVVGATAACMWLLADVAFRDSEAGIWISVWNAFTRFVIYISEGVLLALLRRDREKLRLLAARESALARTDSHTSLPNARAFLEVIDAELEAARAAGSSVCVVYVDLDNFKEINDRFGHAAGDEVLQEVAVVLRRSIRGHDVPARLGGDEFAVLLRGVEAEGAKQVAERIARRVRDLGAAYGGSSLGATIGIAHCRELPESAADLLRRADDAMYEAKTTRKGGVIVQSVCDAASRDQKR